MDLIVYTADGSVQSVSGVNESTTCSQIVYALAHARQQKGRFTLIARLNGSSSQDHRFTPNERPYEFVMKCYEQGLQPEFELLMFDPESHKCDHDEHSQNHALTSSNIPSIGSLKDSSLSYSVDYCRVRPTPPDYNVFMVERCNSLRRCKLLTQKTHTPLTFLNIPNFCLHDLYIHKFEFAQLEALIEIQERTLAAQKTELVRVELTLLDSKERELIQLRKQHNNLLTVLDSLHKSEWQKSVDSESTEAERLNTAIAAMRTAIAEKMREFNEALSLKTTLERQLLNENSVFKLEEKQNFSSNNNE